MNEHVQTATTAPLFNPLAPETVENPYPFHRALREHDPIHRMPDGSYFLSRYDDCAAVYRDPDTWSSDKTHDFRPNFGDSLLYEHHTTSLVFNDPPYHTRVRKLLAPAFAKAPRVTDDERIYNATTEALFEVIGETRGAHRLLVIGHNPSFHDVAVQLVASGEAAARARLAEKLPTSGLVVIDLAVDDWSKLRPHTGRLERYVTPKSIDAASN